MRNSKGTLIFLFIFLISFTSCGQSSNSNFRPFYSIEYMKMSLIGIEKKENFFFGSDINFKLFDPNYYLHNKKDSLYYFSINEPLEFVNNLYKYEHGNIIYQISENVIYEPDFYGNGFNPEYKQWIKSYKKNGQIIDSLQIVYYYAFEGTYQRILSLLESPQEIKTDFNLLSWKFGEEEQPTSTEYNKKTKSFSGYFQINEGKFIYKNSLKNAVFFDGYSYGDLFGNLENDCFSIVKQQLLDIDSDGISDAIYYIKAKNSSCNNGKKTDLVICLADKHGLFRFKSTENLNLDHNKFDISFKPYDGGIIIEISRKNNNQKDLFYYYQQGKMKKWSLEKIEKKDIKNTLISKTMVDTSLYIPIQDILKYLEK